MLERKDENNNTAGVLGAISGPARRSLSRGMFERKNLSLRWVSHYVILYRFATSSNNSCRVEDALPLCSILSTTNSISSKQHFSFLLSFPDHIHQWAFSLGSSFMHLQTQRIRWKVSSKTFPSLECRPKKKKEGQGTPNKALKIAPEESGKKQTNRQKKHKPQPGAGKSSRIPRKLYWT